jgi:hypothetical protein
MATEDYEPVPVDPTAPPVTADPDPDPTDPPTVGDEPPTGG